MQRLDHEVGGMPLSFNSGPVRDGYGFSLLEYTAVPRYSRRLVLSPAMIREGADDLGKPGE